MIEYLDPSLLSRGAWIEMANFFNCLLAYRVAPLTRSVDWNLNCPGIMTHLKSRSSHEERGLKFIFFYFLILLPLSLLSRGAWIEIMLTVSSKCKNTVAPLTRSVDWNKERLNISAPFKKSLLSRGAWIEIWIAVELWHVSKSLLSRGAWIEMFCWVCIVFLNCVAPLTRSVDWNLGRSEFYRNITCRSSHEERGLKFLMTAVMGGCLSSLLSRGAWIEIIFSINAYTHFWVAPLTRSVDWNLTMIIL